MESVARRVVDQVRLTNASRAQFLGIAFATTYLAGGIADAWGMGTLRNHGFMAAQLAGSLAVAVIVRWTHFGRQHAGLVFSVGMSLVSAAGAAHLAQFGGLDGPWFYGVYTAPPVYIPILLSLRLRAAATIGSVAGFAGVYAYFRPDLFAHPMMHIPLVYLVTVSGISIAIGHYVLRLETSTFTHAARLEDVAAALEARLKAEDAAPAHLRREIARQLHDDVAQLITGARFQLDGWSRGRGKDSATRLAELLDELARRSHRMLDELRAPPARGSLVLEFNRLRSEYAGLGLTVDVVFDDESGLEGVGPTQVEVLVSTAREALTNAVRHGRAKEATLSLHEHEGALVLDVFDNGGGRVEAVREGYGLLGIRERVEGLGGQARLSDYEEGLRLSVSIPLRGQA